MTVLRSTTQIVEVGLSYDPKLRQTLQVAYVGYIEALSYARTTQQTIEVLYTSPAVPEARVTKQYIEVIYSTVAVYNRSRESTLSLSQSVSLAGSIYNVVASSSLSLSDVATEYIDRRIGNTLLFTQSAVAEIVVAGTVSSTLVFTQDATVVRNQIYSVEDTLAFTQTAEFKHVLPTKTASNTLSFTQSVAESRPATSILNFTQLAVGVIGGIERSVESTLAFTQSATTAGTVAAASADSTLALAQSVVVGVVVSGATVLSQSLVFTQHAIGTIVQNYITIQAPFPAIEQSIVLPNAELDDKENLVSSLTVKQSMNGTRYTYVKRSDSRQLSYTIDCTRTKGLELQDFLSTYNGEHMRLQNWKAEIWDVVLMTNPLDFVQNRRHSPDGANVAINLQFEGVKLSG